MSTNESKGWFRNSATLKVLGIALLALLLLIPASMVMNLVRERENAFDTVANEIGQKWGYPQTLTGPIITIPYVVKYIDNDGKSYTTKHNAHFLPESLIISSNINPELRYRGIYSVIVYSSRITVSGTFQKPDFSILKIDSNSVLWNEAYLEFGVSDMRGIKNQVKITLNDSQYDVNPGCSKEIFETGISTQLPLISDKIDFALDLDLNGSNQLYFTPLGKSTAISTESKWNNPSFDGAFLPDKRDVSEKGFSASWSILHLNRSYPQQWVDNAYQVSESQFGVKLLLPVDHYQKSMRSAKYAIMFIGLTFLAFFFIETLNKKKIHPVQYLLVGAALCIFYTLLLSLSEHIGFLWAYIVAAIAIITLISAYTYSILNSARLVAITSGILLILYMYLFTILQLQDYALLMGSIGLFIVLAIVMYISRRINWYGESYENE